MRGALLLFVTLVGVYHANGDFLIGDDISPNLKTADQLIRKGEWTIPPADAPVLFHWEWRGPRGWEPVRVRRMSAPIAGRTAAEWLAAGRLRAVDGLYSMLRSKTPGRWVTSYGPGAPLIALPAFAVAHAVTPGDRLTPAVVWRTGKLVASLCVAGAAALVYLIALRAGVGGLPALLVALVFGLGSGAWSISSQSLWQHGPSTWWLTCGLYALVRAVGIDDSRAHRGWAFAAGVALGAAVCTRPTNAMAVIGVGAYLLLAHRALLPALIAGGAPLAVGMGAFNYAFLGMPWTFGQLAISSRIAQARTGSAEVFQIAVYEGAIGLLVSPSRGLLVFSPVMIFAGWGAWRAWRRGPGWLRAVAAIVALSYIPASTHLGWWGGWSYGYRLVVDLTPLLALLLIPVIGDICRRPLLRALFALTLAWSIGVQLLGVVAYDYKGWNGRVGYEVELTDGTRRVLWERAEADQLIAAGQARPLGSGPLNVDEMRYYGRLWSVTDSQLVYLVTHFDRARRARAAEIEEWLREWD